jgi:hypothetical protein
MCPTFGAEPRFGTHPMAWAAPGGKNEADFLFDVATTQVSHSQRFVSSTANLYVFISDLQKVDDKAKIGNFQSKQLKSNIVF